MLTQREVDGWWARVQRELHPEEWTVANRAMLAGAGARLRGTVIEIHGDGGPLASPPLRDALMAFAERDRPDGVTALVFPGTAASASPDAVRRRRRA